MPLRGVCSPGVGKLLQQVVGEAQGPLLQAPAQSASPGARTLTCCASALSKPRACSSPLNTVPCHLKLLLRSNLLHVCSSKNVDCGC
jgi:hypothetical protein